jgi:hypothetical protein
MVYWFTLRAKESMNNIFVWYCRSFETIWQVDQVRVLDEASVFFSHVILEEGMPVDSSKIWDMLGLECPY